VYRYNLGPIRAGHHAHQLHAVQCERVRRPVRIRAIDENFQVGTTLATGVAVGRLSTELSFAAIEDHLKLRRPVKRCKSNRVREEHLQT